MELGSCSVPKLPYYCSPDSCWVPRSECGRNVRNNSTDPERWYEDHSADVVAEPVIEVCSITVLKNGNQDETCRVYGHVLVEDESGNTKCFLYDHPSDAEDDDLDVISSAHHTPLTLTGPLGVVIAMKQPKMYLNIKDKATGASIVEATFFLLNATFDDFEKCRSQVVYGQGGEAHIDYIAFKFGVAAVLEITPIEYVLSDDENEDDDVDIYGSISVYYSNDYCNSDPFPSGKKTAYSTLFQKPPSKSQTGILDSPINLSRSLIVAPAYASIVIDFDLRDRFTNRSLVDGQVIMSARSNPRSDVVAVGKMHIDVRAHWAIPFRLDKASYDSFPVSSTDSLKLPNNGMILNGFLVFDIFSVIIGRQNDEEVSLYGSINVYDITMKKCNIFEATKEDPYTLLSGRKCLPLKFPGGTMAVGRNFVIEIELMDVSGGIYINTFVSSTYGIEFRHSSWFERRLCTVAKGFNESGFAAVNYMVFCAIKAVVKVRLLSVPPIGSGLYGRMVAFYSKYEYTTTDDKEYSRCILFDRSDQKCFNPSGVNSEVELSRSVVPVPMDSSLHVEVNLKLKSGDGVVHHVCDIATFKPGLSDSHFDIEGDSLTVRVSIEWSNW
ncbi:hypothetical protein vseg_002577 [Gypsophila vaccaria]